MCFLKTWLETKPSEGEGAAGQGTDGRRLYPPAWAELVCDNEHPCVRVAWWRAVMVCFSLATMGLGDSPPQLSPPGLQNWETSPQPQPSYAIMFCFRSGLRG